MTYVVCFANKGTKIMEEETCPIIQLCQDKHSRVLSTYKKVVSLLDITSFISSANIEKN